ncbi:MFS transporter [Parahaliea maris]|uniref:MFS transporter n=1 Tax=Parahaliea maris TaxID=2716870 RepID=A0A5C9A6E7_9GAMM|nr:MFS transporter [Parahaliea maris]TXS95340.1 MFS transporter [Parahaliea maris]
MLPLIVPISALLVGVALLLLGTGLLNTLLALRGDLEGYSAGTLGLIMSGYFLGFFVGSLVALKLIHRIGHIRTFAFCAAIACCTVLLHVLFINPYAWFALRVLTGAVLVTLYTVIESWLNGETPPEQRGRVFAIYMAVNLAALALAQQLLNLASPAVFTLFALSAMLVSISLAPVVWTRMRQPEIHTAQRMRLRTLFQIAPVAPAGALLSGLAMGAFWGMGALYAGRVGFDSAGVASFMTCAILGGSLLQYPLGKYSDSHDRRRVLAIVCATAALVAALLIPASGAGRWVLPVIFAYGGLAFAIYPVAVAHLVDHLEQDSILAGGSALLFLHGIGAAFGPALAGRGMEWLGPQALPGYFMLVQLALAGFVFWRLRRVAQVDVSEAVEEAEAESSSTFVPMLRTSPTALELRPDEHVAAESGAANGEPYEEPNKEAETPSDIR